MPKTIESREKPPIAVTVTVTGPRDGARFTECASEAIKIARFLKQDIAFVFGETDLVVSPNDTPGEVAIRFAEHTKTSGQ